MTSPTIQNFLPEQYRQTGALEINHNYLHDQFADHDVIWTKIREVVRRGDFTLGSEVDQVEAEFAAINGVKHAIGVGSGTDALFLSLKALGIDKGDEVITTPYTFYATIGAIVTAGATPVFADARDDYNIDPAEIEKKITSRTKAIMPVHWSGKPCDMDAIEAIAKKHGLAIVSDACHAIKASYKGRHSGELGTIACFSFHPLKNLNVWGDGGIIATNSDELADKLRLLRNHGLAGRDECRVFAYNSRLDTIQAVVARHMLGKIDHITASRIANSQYFDDGLRGIPQITIPAREADVKQVYHLYMVRCEQRDLLQKYLVENNVDAKVHYPVPMHLQPAAAFLGHKMGDFPVTEAIAASALSLPVHEFITREQQDRVIQLIKAFYG
ncbi:putative PLP-dependent enzyme possibly involved in cell wall biogenesis [Herbaspirillum sp. CF444]|uniref:DegT/DnrJ/EryC1/StrS family aminotransferase n=1 Tax=Herbaspirillum sp. CF444 TaxID=1144319 RepID=UPI0002722E1D|nr:DegT/DnrJ/EryC1/StrS family aminotransferase [Herbaspirillum sp. CF444]EJL81424.1 putative PLP-dependent enzyme possibly involved in cell wall biogenesis [Herbaspirillum sp. CF444]